MFCNKHNKCGHEHSRVPGKYGYILGVSLLILLACELIISVLAFYLARANGLDLDILDCILMMPMYCLLKAWQCPILGFEWILAFVRTFFFMAFLAVFYDLYRVCIEFLRARSVEKKIYESFRWEFKRTLGLGQYYLPWYKTFAYLKVHYGLSDDEIIRACKQSNRLRVGCLSLTRSLESYQFDKYVVECFYKNRKYGCKIDVGSNVTIVVPTTQLGMSTFGFYLACIGGFNFVAKQIQDEDSYFNVTKDTFENAMYKDFKADIKSILNDKKRGENQWVVVLCGLNYRKKKEIYFVDADKKKNRTVKSMDLLCRLFGQNLDSPYKLHSLKNSQEDTPNDTSHSLEATIENNSISASQIEPVSQDMKEKKDPESSSAATQQNQSTNQTTSDNEETNVSIVFAEGRAGDDFYLKKNDIDNVDNGTNLLYELGCDGSDKANANGFVLRIPANLNVWNPKRIHLIKALSKMIEPNVSFDEIDTVAKNRRIGYDFKEYLGRARAKR